MARDIPIGNGNMLVAFDKDYILREFCFPHVGEENHVAGHPFRFGAWVNGKFSWVPEGWEIKTDYIDETLVTDVELTNKDRQIRIIANDLVDFHENIYTKKLKIENLSGEVQEIRLFLCHDFRIYGNMAYSRSALMIQMTKKSSAPCSRSMRSCGVKRTLAAWYVTKMIRVQLLCMVS